MIMKGLNPPNLWTQKPQDIFSVTNFKWSEKLQVQCCPNHLSIQPTNSHLVEKVEEGCPLLFILNVVTFKNVSNMKPQNFKFSLKVHFNMFLRILHRLRK